MRIIVAPDKFKSSLTANDVCASIERGIHQVLPDANVALYPLADGGDGFVAALHRYTLAGEVWVDSVDPIGRPIRAPYLWNASTQTAYLELAACSGLALLAAEDRNPLQASTFGTGLQIKHALQQGAKSIVLGLGGSATHDLGMGILEALGFQLLDRWKKPIRATGFTLVDIEHIHPPADLPTASWHIAADVTNVLCGPQGAAHTYAAQKGANANMISFLEAASHHVAGLLQAVTTRSVLQLPSGGAAGGVLAGLYPWFQPIVKPGVDWIIEASGLEQVIQNADWLITGEGKFDEQSLFGKVVGRIATIGQRHQVPVLVVCGASTLTAEQINHWPIAGMCTLKTPDRSTTYCMENAAELVTSSIAAFFRARSSCVPSV